VIKGRGVSIEQLKLFFDQIDIRPFVTGAVQQKLNQANLRRVPYLRATHKIHLAFDTIIAPIYDLVRHQNEESRTLAATRDLLLPKLMSGEIRVKDAETLAEQVT
jgi:type I restriction enzyme S subunit